MPKKDDATRVIDLHIGHAKNFLRENDPSMAMFHFSSAAEVAEKHELWELAAECYENSAYYSRAVAGGRKQAAEDYRSAAEAYRKAGMHELAKTAEWMSVHETDPVDY